MGFRGFEPAKLTALAHQLDGLGRNAGKLHSRLAAVLTTAQANLPSGQPASRDPDLQGLVGDLVVVPIFGRSRLPGSLAGHLDDMQSSMKRRIKQLEGVRELEKQGFKVDQSLVFADAKAPDDKKIAEGLSALEALDGKDFGNNGNRDDLEDVQKKLDGLTAAELDALFAKADPKDLERYGRLMSDTGDSWLTPFDTNGLDENDRRKHLSGMLAKISPQNMAKFTKAFPGVNPDISGIEGSKGVNWAQPTDPLFKDGASANDMNQGMVGDCWYLAELAATAQKNPKFIEEGIKENGNGTVSVRIWDKDGNYEWVTVTKELPYKNGDNFAATGQGDTWPAYYEKAFALRYEDDADGYAGIEADNQEHATPYITGQEGKNLKDGFLGMTGESDIADLKKAHDSGKAITISTPSDDDLNDEGKKELGESYSTQHVYYVRGFTADGKVILGNPWGHQDYPPMTLTQDQLDKYFEADPHAFEVPK